MLDGNKIIEQARILAETESKTQFHTLFKFAIQNGITIKELRDEMRVLLSMSDEEADEISKNMRIR